MNATFDRYWDTLWARGPIRRALLVSLVAHLLVVIAVAYVPKTPPPEPKSVAYEVDLVTPPTPNPEPPQEVAPPPEPEPEPEPPPPEPEPEPEPEPPPPEPEPEPEVEETPPPEPKAEPKPEPRPEPKNEEEPDPPKARKVAKAEPKPQPKPEPKREVQPPAKTGPTLKQQLPPALNGWARLVQRKVEKYWTVPGGIRVGKDGTEAVVSFWVDRQGRLIGKPEIVQHGSDPALAESGVRALMAANPLPPLPDTYPAREQQVIYAFNMR